MLLCMVSTPPVPHRPDSTLFFLPLCLQREAVKSDHRSGRKELQTPEDACRSWIFLLSLGCLRTATDGPTITSKTFCSTSYISLPFSQGLGDPFDCTALYGETKTRLSLSGVCVVAPDHALPVVVPAPLPEPCASVSGREGPGVPTV